MSTELTSTGIVVDRLVDCQNNLVAALTVIFGPFDSDPDDIDGQTVGIFAESESNLNQLAEAILQACTPSTSTGVALSRLVQLNGITRKAATYGTVELTLVGNKNVTVPAGSIVGAADNSSTWTLDLAVTFDATGTAQMSATCTSIGPLPADEGTLNVMKTVIAGWLSVTNADPATPGTNQELDGALRARRAQSVSTPALGVYDALYGELDNLDGVTDMQLYENPTGTSAVSDKNPHGLPANSVYAIVQGGQTQDILDAIWLKKGLGVFTVGAVSGTVLDSQGNPHIVDFDRPGNFNVFVTINVKTLAGYPTNGDALIAAAVAAYALDTYAIGDPVITSELYSPINTIPKISIQSVYVGNGAMPSSSQDLQTPYNSLAAILVGNVVVNHV
jgi:uncharacterized phage protein gp47/JayE